MTREKGADEIFCRSCGEPIKRAAEICPECGVRNELSATASLSGTAPISRTLHDPSDYETTVSDSWYYGIAAGILLWILGFAIFSGEPAGVVEDIGGFSLLIAWVLLPVAVYYDSKYVRANSRWNPNTVVWIIASVVWFINIIAGLVYLYRRYEVLGFR